MSEHDFKKIEAKWQKRWEESRAFEAQEENSQKPKYYCLTMFPYPSGKIHMGHVRVYTIGDVLARFKRMQGYEVLHPIGWDGFGLPAENAAIERGVDPEKWTRENIFFMKKQLKALGLSYDWKREITTCDTEYYKWNQWLFLKLYEKGLVYRKKAFVNFCSSCQTVLANEQVEDSRCWRCESEVIQKDLEQWFFKITAYAEELLSGHDRLMKGWPARVLVMQKNWIGKSQGTLVDFLLEKKQENTDRIQVYTTRPDTLFGCTFMVLAPEHPLVLKLTKGKPCEKKVLEFVEKMKRTSRRARQAADVSKEGIFLEACAVNPVNQERIPVWTANYVLYEYGTGTIMAVPAHDQRDYDFAKMHDIPIVEVIHPEGEVCQTLACAYEGEGILVRSEEFNLLPSPEAKLKITEWLAKKDLAKEAINYKLKDWLISRQRYWGTPIPMVHCPKCGTVPVKENDLPVLLPKEAPFTGKGESPLSRVGSFMNTNCPKCKGPAKRETDTMDTFVDSSWYYARYTDPACGTNPFSRKKADFWLPVDQYVGGIEHACMHLLYARFFHFCMRDLGLVSSQEPFLRLLTQGMVIKDGAKMSKSKGNIVDPDDILKRVGADAARLYILFEAPPERDVDWSDERLAGASRFLQRVYRLLSLPSSSAPDAKSEMALWQKTHETIHRVTRDIENEFQFNTAIAAIMELVNMIQELHLSLGKESLKTSLKTLALLLSPFAPHTSCELWERLGAEGTLMDQPWPKADPRALERERFTLVVQVNGKLKTRLEVAANLSEEALVRLAREHPRVKEIINGKEVRQVIVVPKKLVNLVTLI